MILKIGLLWIFHVYFISNVDGQCLKCDSENDPEESCSFDSITNPGVVQCNPFLGCFTQLSKSTNEDYDGYYTERGCLTENQECKEGTCTSCKTQNCNSQVYPLNRPRCLKCSGGNCLTAKSEYCRVFIPDKNECVTLFDDDGEVLLRTCYSDIPKITRELCDDQNYIDCKKCQGSNCNNHEKRDGLKCHQCSGIDCLIVSTSATLVDCQSSCYIGKDVNGFPVRGCANKFNTALCSTDESSNAECFICDNDGCNGIVYPYVGRLQCHICLNGNCDPSDDNIELCPRYGADEKCASVFAEKEDKVIARGCTSALETQYQTKCNSDDMNCLKCGYDNCNKDDSKKKQEFCIVCNSQEDPDCLQDNSNLEQRCLTNRCYTRFIGQFIERGCMDDLQTCTQPDCIECQGKNCNNKKFPENRISCKSCQFDSCKGKTTDKICNRYTKNEACITIYGDKSNVVLRDCYSDVAEGARSLCDDSTNLECSKCTGSLCNVDTKRRGNKCYKCEGIDCLKPTVGDTIDCLSQCFVGVNEKGETIRGCAKDFKQSPNCGVSDLSCMLCDEDFCNNIVYPIRNRLTCQKCTSYDCGALNVVSEYCERLHKDEKCVTIFNDKDEVIERGCLSALQNSRACSTNGKCLNCGFDECNVETSAKEIYRCVSCDSKTDGKCVLMPNSTSTVGCSQDSCYSRLIDTRIERGCSADIQCTSANSCQTCKGERCNSQIYPSARHSCYYCSGDHCALGHLKERLCVTYNANDKNCMTLYGEQKEVIYRGCYIDAVKETQNLCDDAGDLTCTKCSGKNCNSDKLRRGTRCVKCEGLDCFGANDKSNSIDCLTGGCYVGLNENGDIKRDCASAISTSSKCVKNDTTKNGTCLVCDDDYCNAIVYPMNNRKICLSCVGDLCNENLNDEKYCERINANEQCVTIFNSLNKIIERGCISSISNPRSCQGNNPNCLKCSFNRCNIQDSKENVYHCVACNSKDDPNCVRDSQSPSVQACATNQCYSRLIGIENSSWYHIEKGCASQLPNLASCTGSSCTVCEGDRCNNVIYPSDRMTCLTCKNKECGNSTTTTQNYCKLYNRQMQGCITLFDIYDQVNYRGCFSDAADGTQEVCSDPSQLLCTKCKNKNCNIDIKRRGKKCFKCSGLECFTPNYPADVVDCLSDCYVGVNEKGETIRDCASAITNTTGCGDTDNGISRCSICSDDLCNSIQFPLKNRLQCHSCNDPNNCKADDNNLEFCERFSEQEKCVTVFSKDTNEKVIERGCTSVLKNKLYCSQNYKNCINCRGVGCNSIETKNTKQCVICDSSTNPDCVQNPSILPTKACADSCYTRLNQSNLVRGCLSDLETSFVCNQSTQCQHCNDIDKCNVGNYPPDRKFCLTCNSELTCKAPSSQLCVNYRKAESCVSIFTGYHVVRRGCLSDQSQLSQNICSVPSNNLCKSCSSGNNCNYDNVRADENCINCNSAIDGNCAQRPNILPSDHCTTPSDGECFERIFNGATIRGCKGNLDGIELTNCRNMTTSSQCKVTRGQGSNNEIIPVDRIRCHHCDSRIDPTCDDEFDKRRNSTLPCKIFNQPESCIKIKINDGVIRGCEADFSTSICQQGECFRCNEPGCNHGNLPKTSILCTFLSFFILFIKLTRFL